jgi:hypothetical protein
MQPPPEAPTLVELIRFSKPPGEENRCPGPSRVGEGGEPGRLVVKSCPPMTIINEGKRWSGLLPGLVLFRLVAPPLQLGVMGPYPIRGVWFPSHLLLEGTGRI